MFIKLRTNSMNISVNENMTCDSSKWKMKHFLSKMKKSYIKEHAKAKLGVSNPFLWYKHAMYFSLSCAGGKKLIRL